MMKVTAICEVNGGGVQVSAVAVFNASEILEHLNVKGRTIVNRYLHNAPEKTENPTGGTYAILELDPRDKVQPLREMVGKPPHFQTAYREPKVTVVNGEERIESTDTRFMVVEKFHSGEFTDPNSKNSLSFWLYTPANLVEGEKYPLVTFIHDAGSCSADKRTGLLQGNGGIVWAEEKWQKEHPCFVLVPYYSHAIVNDNCECTWEVEATNALIDALVGTHPIDKNRLYLTGQSMGAMTSCELLSSYPGKWAGAYLVAGQWDPESMAKAKSANIWYVVSEGDKKAYPGMKAIASVWEREGEKIAWGAYEAMDPFVNVQAQKLADEGKHLVCTIYTGDSVILPGMPQFPGVHHISTWIHAYNVETIREWLFRCQLDKKRS